MPYDDFFVKVEINFIIHIKTLQNIIVLVCPYFSL